MPQEIPGPRLDHVDFDELSEKIAVVFKVHERIPAAPAAPSPLLLPFNEDIEALPNANPIQLRCHPLLKLLNRLVPVKLYFRGNIVLPPR